jgi:hypothetical protein
MSQQEGSFFMPIIKAAPETCFSWHRLIKGGNIAQSPAVADLIPTPAHATKVNSPARKPVRFVKKE